MKPSGCGDTDTGTRLGLLTAAGESPWHGDRTKGLMLIGPNSCLPLSTKTLEKKIYNYMFGANCLFFGKDTFQCCDREVIKVIKIHKKLNFERVIVIS